MSRKARALVRLDAIRHNYRLAKSLHPTTKAVAVVKADAYGHGAVAVARMLESEADAFGVASIEEAMVLREAGVNAPVTLLEGFFDPSELPLIDQHGFWIVVHSAHQIDALSRYTPSAPINVWLKMDSGMHRLGIPVTEFRSAYDRLRALPHIGEIVLMTHFACADELSSPATHQQIQCFQQTVQGIQAPHSLSNSPATLGWPEAKGDWLRPGIMLYGISPFDVDQTHATQLQPAMSLLSEVIAIREIQQGESVGYGASWTAGRATRVGTVAMGYGDGFPRQAKSGTPVMVNGERTQIIGRVSMDMMTVDLTDIPSAGIGASVELWGENLSINEVAGYCDTIPYTLVTGLTNRVVRHYI